MMIVEPRTRNSALPQGAVMRPILFSVYLSLDEMCSAIVSSINEEYSNSIFI